MRLFLAVLLLAVTAEAQQLAGPQINFTPPRGGGSSSLIPGTTTFVTGTDCLAYADASGILRCTLNNFGSFDAGAGDMVFTLRKTMSGAASSNNFFRISGTLPSSTSATTNAATYSITTAGSSAFPQQGISINMLAGYTGASNVIALATNNAAAGTGTSNPMIGVAAQATGAGAVGIGAYMTAVGVTTNSSYGGAGLAQSLGTPQVGLLGYSGGTNSASAGAGLLGLVTDTFAVDFNTAVVPFILGKTAIGASNSTTTYDLIRLNDNTTEVFAVGDGGDYRYYRTITAAGTTGARTIDKPAGCVNFAAAATTLVVTNALAATTSIVLANAQTNDTTCWVKDIERAAGSFTIRMVAACTAETAVCYLLTN